MSTYQKTRVTHSVLSNLSGPPGLLIGEKNRSHLTSSVNQHANTNKFQQGGKQKIRVDVNRNYPARGRVAEELATSLYQSNPQAIIRRENDEFPLISERRIVISDRLHDEKSSVFDRLGPKIKEKTYSVVVGGPNQKRNNRDISGDI